jgi:ABC-2 type transport system permease protein
MNVTTALGTMPTARVVRAYLTEAKYESLRLLRTPGFVLPTLLFPLMFYSLFGIVLAGSRASAQAAAPIFVSYCIFGSMAPGLFGFGITLAIERDQGIVTYKRAVPMPAAAFLCAKMLMAMLFVGIVATSLIVAAVTAAHVQLGVTQYLAIAFVAILGVLPFCALGFFIGSRATAAAAPAVTNLIYLPMAFLSGLWVPLAFLPQFVRSIAPIWPPYHLSQLAFAAAGLRYEGTVTVHVVVLAIVTFVFASLAARRLARVG